MSGQAAIEYILLLAITIAVVLLFKEFYKRAIAPKLNFALGGYIECLLESGSLPALGDNTSKQEFAALTSTDGKCKLAASDLSGLGGTSGGSSGGASGGSSSGGSSSGSTGSSGGSSGSSSGGSSGGSTGGSSGSRGGSTSGGFSSGASGGASSGGANGGSSGGRSANSSRNSSSSSSNTNSGYSSPASSGSGAGEDGERDNPTRKKKSSPLGLGSNRRSILPIRDSNGMTGTDGSLGPNDGKVKSSENSAMNEMGDEYGRGGRRSRNRGYRSRSISGAMQSEYERELAENGRSISGSTKRKVANAGEVGTDLQEARRKVDPPPPRKLAEATDSQDSGLGFGDIFKYLLIAAIVIVIIIFGGNQFMNYSNSQEK